MREASNGVSISVSSPWEVAPRNQPPIAPAQSRRDEIASATDEIEAPPLTDPSRLRKQAGGPPTLPPHGRLTLALTLTLTLALTLALTLTLTQQAGWLLVSLAVDPEVCWGQGQGQG